MWPRNKAKKMNETQMEDAIMDVLMDGAGTEQDIAEDAGLPAEITRNIIESLHARGLVEPYITKHGKPMWDMARTRKGK